MDGSGLPAYQGGVHHVGVAAAAGGEDGQDGARQTEQRRALRIDHAARNVALRDVAELVRQHRRQLVARGRHRDEPQVDAHPAAGQGKGVDVAVAHQKCVPGELAVHVTVHFTARARSGHQGAPQRNQIFLQDGVVKVVGVAHDLAHDLLAQAALTARREVFGGGFAQRRQPHLCPGGGRVQTQAEQRGKCQGLESCRAVVHWVPIDAPQLWRA